MMIAKLDTDIVIMQSNHSNVLMTIAYCCYRFTVYRRQSKEISRYYRIGHSLQYWWRRLWLHACWWCFFTALFRSKVFLLDAFLSSLADGFEIRKKTIGIKCNADSNTIIIMSRHCVSSLRSSPRRHGHSETIDGESACRPTGLAGVCYH